MRWSLATIWPTLLLALASGCRSSCEHVEQELRAREVDVRHLREELDRTCSYSHALEHELRTLRGHGPGAPALLSTPVRSLELGRGTGGYDGDASLGDEGIQVVLVPRDPEGHAVKVPGTASIQLFEVSPEGLKILLSTWEVPPDQLTQSWRGGLLTTGYSLVLPWKSLPFSEKGRVVARLQLADGRVLEADKDITLRVPPARTRRMPHADSAPPPAAAPAPTPPAGETPADPAPPASLPTVPPTATDGPALLPPPRKLPAPDQTPLPAPQGADTDDGPRLGKAGRPFSPAQPARILRPVGHRSSYQ